MKMFFNHRLSRIVLIRQVILLVVCLSGFSAFSYTFPQASASETINGVTWEGWAETPRHDVVGCIVPDTHKGAVVVPSSLEGFTVDYLVYQTFGSLYTGYSYSSFGIKASKPVDLVLPQNVRVYGHAYGLFQGCTKLASVTIPANFSFNDQYEGAMPYTINNDTFRGCTSLTNVIADKMTFGLLTTNMFNGCIKLATASFSSKVTGIGKNAFSGCSVLSSVSFAGKVPTGFNNCGIRKEAWINITTNTYAGWKKTGRRLVATKTVLDPFSAIKLRNALDGKLDGITNIVSRTDDATIKKIVNKSLSPITTHSADVLYIDGGGTTYSVKFNANGGNGTMPNQAFVYGVYQNLLGNSFSRDGYSFVGWAESVNGEKVYDDNQMVGNLTKTENGKVNLYAVWEKMPPSSVAIHAGSRCPWNGLVDIHFTITGDAGTKYDTSFTAKDMVGNTNIAMRTIRKADGTAAAAKEQLLPGTYNWVWDAAADLPDGFQCERVTVEVTAE